MVIWELLAVSFGLSLDAFAVSICKGLSMKKFHYQNALITGLYFGVFQALMPLFGYLLGIQFKDDIVFIDHWLAFLILSAIGLKMIKESRDSSKATDGGFNFWNMAGLAIATSMDAFAVGITLALLNVQIIPAVSMIGFLTFLISFFGVRIGYHFGYRLRSKSEVAGGLILILIGLRILIEHLTH